MNNVLDKCSAVTPILFALILPLHIGVINLDEVSFRYIVIACMAAAFFAGVLHASLFVLGAKAKSALYATTVIVAMSLYGPALDFISSFKAVSTLWFSVFWCVAVMALLAFVRRGGAWVESVRRGAFLVGVLFLAQIIFQYLSHDSFAYRAQNVFQKAIKIGSHVHQAPLPQDDSIPQTTMVEKPTEQTNNVFYIILDGYPRADKLLEIYGFDNQPFLKELKQRGFYIAEQSRSNYPVTDYSIASSLNMQHVNEVSFLNSPQKIDKFYQLIIDPEVPRTFKQLGYDYAVVASYWGPFYKKPALADSFYMPLYHQVHPFFNVVLSQTPARLGLSNLLARQHLYQFDKLSQIAQSSSQKQFVFSHIIMPHPPYCFEQTGAIRNYHVQEKWSQKELFVEQLKFLNRKVLDFIDVAMAQPQKPIIIIHGDHGTAALSENNLAGPSTPSEMNERYAILNTFYVPESVERHLYPQITPVNNFRLLLKHYYDLDVSPIDDVQYFSWYDQFSDFVQVHFEDLKG